MHQFRAAVGEAQVIERDRIHREEADGGAVFGSHVADGGAIGQRQGTHAGAIEFYKFADDTLLAEHLGGGEDKISSSGAFGHFAAQLKANNLRQQHGDGLAQHAGFGFDTADTPTNNAHAVDHGGVRIGAHQAIGIGLQFAFNRLTEDNTGQIFEIDLVNDAGIGRHNAEIIERFLAPAQERIALLIAAEFENRRFLERLAACRTNRLAPSDQSPGRPESADWPVRVCRQVS